MFKEIVAKVIAFVKQAEVDLAGKTGAEKKAAVIKLVCGTIDIPLVPNWIENIFKPMLVSALVDIIVKWWNAATGGHIDAIPANDANADMTAKAVQAELAAAARGKVIELPCEKTAEAPNITDINARFDALVKEKLAA
jgi:hypothetical protein